MLGLMQDRPLVLPHIFHRAEQLFGHKKIITAEVGRERITTVADWADRDAPAGHVLDDLGCPRTHGWPRSAGTPAGTWSCTSPHRAPDGCCTPSTSGCSPTAGLRRQPRRGRGRLRRPLAAAAVHAAGRQAGHGQAHRRDRRRRATARYPTTRILDYEELLAAAAPFAGLRRPGREHRRSHVLHVGDHRGPQGRGLQPPIDRAALAGAAHRRLRGAVGARRRAAGRPDVPRQRVGVAVRGRAGRLRPGLPRPEHDPAGARRLLERTG